MSMQIELSRILVDDTLSPRQRLDMRHVDEFVEMGEWPPVLLRPITHQWYTHQLVDGFHRFEAAQRLSQTAIEARVEMLADDEAIARALRENLHGKAIAPEERKAVCVRLRELGWKQERIAKETGVVQKQVSVYLAAERVEQEIYTSSINQPDQRQPTIEQKAPIARLIPKDNQPILIADPKREAARAQAPTIYEAARDHKLPPATVSALVDATLDAPEHTTAMIAKTVESGLAPDAIRKMGKVLGDPAAPTALKAHNLQPDTMIHDQHGAYPASEIERAIDLATKQTPEHHAMPFASALIGIDKVTAVTPDAIEAWIATADADMVAIAENTLATLSEWLSTAQQQFQASRKRRLHIL